MQLEHRIDNSVCIISIEGNIALDGVNDVKGYVKTFLEDESVKAIVLNFSKVDFIDSSGIGLVVSIFKALQGRQAKFALCHLSKKNTEIFSMTRLDKILSIYGTEDEALASI
ncbi:MAG: STAS domain-containing protein [SAR324 cluster bacterium]|nr:STAS domain-containing protein [SAR324 cluster bacterium]